MTYEPSSNVVGEAVKAKGCGVVFWRGSSGPAPISGPGVGRCRDPAVGTCAAHEPSRHRSRCPGVSVFSCHDITSRRQQVPRQNLLTFSISAWVTRKDRRSRSRYISIATSDSCLSQRLGRKIDPRGMSLRTRTDHHMTVMAAGARDLLRT